jgi:hypothetical protein
MRIVYEGPPSGVRRLAKELEDAGGGGVTYNAPLEKRGAEESIVQIVVTVGTWAGSGVVGGAAFAAAQHVVRNFLNRHPGTDASVEKD